MVDWSGHSGMPTDRRYRFMAERLRGVSPRAGALVAALACLVLAGGPAAAGASPAGPSRASLRLADPRITEASGLAVGHVSPGVLYVQNDSGDTHRFFAVDGRSGATAATITVRGARNVDWEDLAVAPDRSGRWCVWLADIGDNDDARREVQVYRVAEPRVRPGDRGRTLQTAPAEVFRLRYPDGAADAESLAVGPDGTAYVITKSLIGASTVYRVPPRPDRHHVQTLLRVGSIEFRPHGTANPFGAIGEVTATGATMSADGQLLVVRTYSDAYAWTVSRGDLGGALAAPPVRIPLPAQPQGEGVAVSGSQLLVDSEGGHSAVYRVRLPAAARHPAAPRSSATQAPAATPSARPVPAAGPVPAGRSTGGQAAAVAAAAVVLLGLVCVGLWWRGRRRSVRSG